jgi:hypothetical protein
MYSDGSSFGWLFEDLMVVTSPVAVATTAEEDVEEDTTR